MESIPLRVLVLLIGEVFGVRSRNAWFRRRLVALLNQFVHATMGSSLNRKIIDIVQWLTSKQQVAQYLAAFRYKCSCCAFCFFMIFNFFQNFLYFQLRLILLQINCKVLRNITFDVA